MKLLIRFGLFCVICLGTILGLACPQSCQLRRQGSLKGSSFMCRFIPMFITAITNEKFF